MASTAPREAPPPRQGTDNRQRQALVGVRLNADELAALKTVAERDGLSLPSALRQSFLSAVGMGRADQGVPA
jgi:hypothetical protein